MDTHDTVGRSLGYGPEQRADDVARHRILVLEAALRDAIEFAEDYAQYVGDFLLEKWGHADDMRALRDVLKDGFVFVEGTITQEQADAVKRAHNDGRIGDAEDH